MLRQQPRLFHSQLQFRIGLARSRSAAYPLHKLDFIMMDLERPETSTRHADWCTGDLTGRLLEFLACAEGIDGKHDPRLPELFERILRTRRPSGLFGRYAATGSTRVAPEESPTGGAHRLFPGFIRYYEATGDWRGLDAAVGIAEWLLRRRDAWAEQLLHPGAMMIEFWVTEPLARLYHHTGEERYLELCRLIAAALTRFEHVHSHGLMSTMRGLQLAALYTGDAEYAAGSERLRQRVVAEHWEMPDGCIGEVFPRNFRNEGCSIADWLMLNLNAARLTGEASAYEKAQNTLWNALFFNQFISGSFGHRHLRPHGYGAAPLEEAWWCCLHHCGMAMTEYARHAVSFRDDAVCVDLLVPGEFRVSTAAGQEAIVTVTTGFPATADTQVTVRGLPETAGVRVRVPECVRNARLAEARAGGTAKVRLIGDIGHYTEVCNGGVLLRYGPLVLAPMTYHWGDGGQSCHDSSVPAGYIPASLPAGQPRLVLGEPDSRGLLALEREPLPEWSYFEEGPDAELSVAGASVNVPVEFPGGARATLRFWPMCALTSNMTYNDTPIVFAS